MARKREYRWDTARPVGLIEQIFEMRRGLLDEDVYVVFKIGLLICVLYEFGLQSEK